MSIEKEVLREPRILVTTKRIVVDADTYAVANVTSVKDRYSDVVDVDVPKTNKWKRFLNCFSLF